MRWRGGRRSSNVEDRRGRRVSRRGVAGGGLGTIVLILVALYFGIDPTPLLQDINQGAVQQSPAGRPLADFHLVHEAGAAGGFYRKADTDALAATLQVGVNMFCRIFSQADTHLIYPAAELASSSACLER